MFTIRTFEHRDITEIVELFYNTVHEINKKDYTLEQLHAWAPLHEKNEKILEWPASLAQNMTYVAVHNDKIIGFVDMTHLGHLDRLYVHKDWQRKGVASLLLAAVEHDASKLQLSVIHTEVSITALPFFQHHQFVVKEKQTVIRHHIELTNFIMEKTVR